MPKRQLGAVWVPRCWLDPSELAPCCPVSTTSPLSRSFRCVSQREAQCAPRSCCSGAAGGARLGLVPAGAAPLRHGFLCSLSSTSHCAVVFWGYFPPGAWSHEGGEEAFLKTSSCSSAVLEAAGSGLCDAPLGGAVERTGEGFSLTLFSCLLFAP